MVDASIHNKKGINPLFARYIAYLTYVMTLFFLPFALALAFTQGGETHFYDQRNAVPDYVRMLPDPKSGAMTYSYPIDVPPGRDKMTPKFNLTYTSGDVRNDSQFGYGWSIDLPSIQRYPKYGVPEMYTATSSFYSSLDGELIKTSSGTSTPVIYGPKIENGSFNKYELKNDTYWVVTAKNGTSYKFGYSTSTRQTDPNSDSRVFKWMLEEARDTNNNYIAYHYFKDLGQIYASTTIYTGNNITDGPFKVDFYRESRNDIATSSQAGFASSSVTRYRISEIRTSINGTWVKKIALGYSVGSNTRRSLLSSITVTGQDELGGTLTLPPTTFGYQNVGTSTKWTADSSYSIPVSFSSNNNDTGVAVEDVNGDALPDIIQNYTDGSGSRVKHVWINKGDGTGWSEDTNYTTPEANLPEAFISATTDLGTRLVDVNGDGYVDIIRAYDPGSGTTTRVVYLNKTDGTGWREDTNYTLPTYFIVGGTDHAVRLFDVNGDGLADIVRNYADGMGSSTKNVYLNKGDGTGWAEETSYVRPPNRLPEAFLSGTTELGTRIADINGDGLQDIIRAWTDGASGDIRRVYLNNGDGTGWTENPGYSIPTYFVSNGFDRGVRLFDVNGDNLPDFVRNWTDGHGTVLKNVWINKGDGTGWVEDTSYNTPASNIPEIFTNDDPYTDAGTRTSDIDGDGMMDVIRSWDNGSGTSIKSVNISSIQKADLLATSTDSRGATTTITYKASPKYLGGTSRTINPKLPFVLDTVYRKSVADGISPTTTTTFTYSGGRYFYGSHFDREYAGFATVTAADTAGNTSTTFFHQASSTDTAHGAFSDSEWKIGKVYRTESSDSSGNLYAKTTNKWIDTDLGNGRKFVSLSQTLQSSYDGNSTHRDKAEANTYESTYGNLIQNIKYGEVTGSDDGTFSDIGSDIASTTISYAASTTLYIVGLPSTETTQNQSLTKLKETKHYYDTLSSGSVSKGNETKTENWATSTTYASTTKTYDAIYGLVTQSRDPNYNLTTYTLDTLNLYPATTTNALSHTTGYTYDYATGKVKNTFDANSKLFTTTYDALRRPLTINIPDPFTGSLVTKTSYSYTDSATPGSTFIQETNNLNSATSSVSLTYFDGFGRKLQERKQADPTNTYAVTDYAYNNLGLLASTSLPYFSSSTSKTTATTSAKIYTQLTYDPLQRVTQTVNAVGTTTSAYDDWRTRVTDALSHVKDFWKDAFGNLANVVEKNGSTIATTTYAYDAVNNLTKITDAAANIRNFTYDGLSRRLTSEDLHTVADTLYGTSTYAYDAASNLTQFRNPRNQTINYTYDNLNRVLTEDYTGVAGTEVSYTYDSCTNGKGFLCYATTTDNSQSMISKKTYNALGLVATDTKQVVSQTYNTGYSYDRQGNITKIVYPDSSEVRYTYGPTYKPVKIEQRETTGSAWRDLVSSVTYSPMAQEVQIVWGSKATTTNTYDSNQLYRLTNILTVAPEGTGEGLMAGGGGEEMLGIDLDSGKKYSYAEASQLYAAIVEDLENSSESTIPAIVDPAPEVVDDVATSSDETTKVDEDPVASLIELTTATTTSESLGTETTAVEATTAEIAIQAEEQKVDTKKEVEESFKLAFSTQLSDSGTQGVEIIKSKPEIRLQKWDGELNVGIAYSGPTSTATKIVDTDIYEWKGAAESVQAYTLPPKQGMEDGGLEMEVVLNKKPSSNEFDFAIDGAEDLEFLYQPPLTEDEKDPQTDHCTETQCFDKNGSTTAERAENVVGSYAVYSKTFKNYAQGETNYGSGKVVHIFRPKAIDAGGKETWCEMNYEKGLLKVTCPDEFLNNASYPVTVDPTIGYTSIGASTVNVVDDVIFCSNMNTSISTAGSITSVQFYGKRTSGTSAVRSGLYTTGNALQSPTSSAQSINSSTSQWWVNSWSGPTVSTGTAYMPCTFFNAVTNNITVNYDTGSTGDTKVQITGYPTWPGTFSPGDSTRRYSIYGTYATATAAFQMLQNISYTYDAIGNITNITDNSNTGAGKVVTLGYDDLNRLTFASTTAASSTPFRYSYAYDVLGNITALSTSTGATTTYTYAGTNYANPDAMTSFGAHTYAYDQSGNLTSKPNTSYAWNWRDRMSISSTSVITIYSYDEADRRIRTDDGTTIYHYPNDFYQTDSVSALPTKYVFLNGKSIATLTGSTGSATPDYTFVDHLGSTNVVVDDGNNVLQTLDYYPYGGRRINSGSDVSHREYIGQVYDNDTSLNFLNARYYNGTQGQFISQDPIFLSDPRQQNLRDPQSLNSYSYANDNPIANKDPNGRGLIDLALILLLMPQRAYAPSSESDLQTLSNQPPEIIVGGDAVPVRGGVAVSGGVYQGVDPATGAVRYVGRTDRVPMERFNEHAQSGTERAGLEYKVMPGSDSYTPIQRRLYEQSLIDKYGLQKNGGQLINKINSISQSSQLYGSVQSFNPGTVSNSTPMTSAAIFPGMPNFRGTYDFGSGGVYNFSIGQAQKVK